MVWRGKGRRKAARALKGAGGGSEGQSAGSPAPKMKSRTPLPKGRSSKRRDGGGRGGRRGGRGGDDDERGERGRMARPQSSPAPFIIAGAFVLGAIVIVAIVASSKRESARYAETTHDAGSGGGYSSSGGGSGSTGYSANRSSSAPPRPRGGSASVEIRPVLRGLSRAGDERGWTAACGRCGTRFTSRVVTCPNSPCGAALRWDTRKRIKCKFCRPVEKLTVADLHEIPENDRHGFCAFCGGSGKDPDYKADTSYIAFGITRDGTGSGVKPGGCGICKASGKCMKCIGNGWVDMPESFLP
ncbi:MAG: hypothetical protein ACYTKD_16870 [Planctomycetota bacterium]|jgi:hypothetical protein